MVKSGQPWERERDCSKSKHTFLCLRFTLSPVETGNVWRSKHDQTLFGDQPFSRLGT